MAATCRFCHWDNPAASDSNPVTPVLYFGWRQPSDGLVDSDGEALLWHLEDCVLKMDEILQEARDMRVVFDLRDDRLVPLRGRCSQWRLSSRAGF